MQDKQSNLSAQPNHIPSRREFLTRAGKLAGGMALLGMPGFGTRAEGGTVARSAPAGGQFAFELDGQIVDFLKSTAVSPVKTIPTGPGQFANKHIGPPTYTDITLQTDPFLPKPLHQWIKDTLNMKFSRHSGAIITVDRQSKEQSRQQFMEALISEVTFPACDTTSRMPVYLTIKLASEITNSMPGKGALVRTPPGAKQKTWLPGNFRLRIQGLEAACSRVSKIDALTIKQDIKRVQSGENRHSQLEPTKLEFPHLVITVPETHAGPFAAWHKDVSINRIAEPPRGRPGALDFVAQNGKDILFRLLFHNLGIVSFAANKQQDVTVSLRTVKVEMYCERMTLA